MIARGKQKHPVVLVSSIDFKKWADSKNIYILGAPPYTSKYNPIEHRLFPRLTRVCQGVIFQSVEMVRELMTKAKTQTGLEVFAAILDKAYETDRKVTEEFKQTMEIAFDEYLPQRNYTASPQIL